MSLDKNKVSILISYYNDRDFLRDAVQSVLSQDYQNFEIILLNHASTDGSREIAHSFNDERVRHIDYPKNLGAISGVLLRAMFDCSTGEYIKFLSADDMISPGGLRKLVDYLDNDPTVDFAFGNVEYVDSKGKSLGTNFYRERYGFDIRDDRSSLLKKFYKAVSCLPYNGQIVRRNAVRRDYLEPTFIMVFDMYLWARLLLDYHNIGFIDDIVGFYRIHNGQTSGIAQREKVLQRTRYESLTYQWLFAKNVDATTVKLLEPDFPNLENVKTNEDAYFVIMYSQFVRTRNPVYYQALQELLLDEQTAAHLQNAFGFDVAEFRKLYATLDPDKKRAAREQSGKYLDMSQLLFLVMSRIHRTVNFGRIKSIFKKKKKAYTM